jgi:uncharacterized protein YdeI (YjbR/CyaY-like superfamily)
MAKRDSSVLVPGELAKALRRNPRLASAFDAMPASHRREYATWVGSAKKAETRESRAADADISHHGWGAFTSATRT